MKTIFITGSTGFIGQRLVRAMDGNIRVLSRNNHPEYDTIVCDLESQLIPEKSLVGVKTVFHLASFTSDGCNSAKIQKLYQKVNVDATIKLAEMAVKSNVKKFVFVSSVKAGGAPAFGTCGTEKNLNNPKGIYGKTKREAELKLLKIGNESNMNVTIIRSSLVYGPFSKGNIKLMMTGIKKGWFPPLPDTKNKKSMIHVDDLVRAILFVAEDDRANGEIFNATDSNPYSPRQIYHLIQIALGKSISKWSVPEFMFNIVSLINYRIKDKVKKILGDECYSSAKLEALGFKPQKTLRDINETDF
jgi:UDP-glucose 4-epimerase